MLYLKRRPFCENAYHEDTYIGKSKRAAVVQSDSDVFFSLKKRDGKPQHFLQRTNFSLDKTLSKTVFLLFYYEYYKNTIFYGVLIKGLSKTH